MAPPPQRGRQAEAERNDEALLEAARQVLGEDGVHATVAAIAARAGVGIGTLYRRYRTKEELFQRLCSIALEEYLIAAQEGLAAEDAWQGLLHYVHKAIALGSGSLGVVAGMVEVTPAMEDLYERGDIAVAALVRRALDHGVLRTDVTDVDLSLLIEHLAKSPVVEQLSRQGRADLMDAARSAHARIVAIALDGLRAPAPTPLPGSAPSEALFSERWATSP
jgi:AcrR family transcriptional regulator